MRTSSDTLKQGRLGDWFAGQAEQYSAARARANSRWLWSAVVLLPALALLWLAAAVSGKLLTVLAVAAVIMAGVWGYQPIAAAHKTAAALSGLSKSNDSFGLAYEVEAEAGPEFDAARSFGLVPGFDRAAFGHRWFGQFEGREVSLYDAHLETSRGSGKNRQWDTAFRGAIIRMDFGREFGVTTLLQRAGAHRTWLGLGASRSSINADGHRLDLVPEIDPEYAEVFAVFSDDPGAARALVKPSYVERLLELESALGAQELRALFAKGSVIIAVEGGSIGAAEHCEALAALTGLAQAITASDAGPVTQAARQSATEI
ncbi:MAG TPA: DUF3137 domain-containing protein [Erythrobacter sp.]|nr:DUF3137 domain-containing protein [Erythrobacter sp.]